jgi:hypothetical protein
MEEVGTLLCNKKMSALIMDRVMVPAFLAGPTGFQIESNAIHAHPTPK